MFRLLNRPAALLIGACCCMIVLLGSPGLLKAADGFIDIQGHWAQPIIAKMVANQSISGYPDKTFRPENSITRAEFCAILMNALKLQPKSNVTVYLDTYKHWAKDYISNAAAYGIVSGYDALHFGAEDPVTREQMAVMIAHACNLNGSQADLAFKDAAQISSWSRQSVAVVLQKKLMSGYPDNTFRPKSLATRAEAAAVINQALNLKK